MQLACVSMVAFAIAARVVLTKFSSERIRLGRSLRSTQFSRPTQMYRPPTAPKMRPTTFERVWPKSSDFSRSEPSRTSAKAGMFSQNLHGNLTPSQRDSKNLHAASSGSKSRATRDKLVSRAAMRRRGNVEPEPQPNFFQRFWRGAKKFFKEVRRMQFVVWGGKRALDKEYRADQRDNVEFWYDDMGKMKPEFRGIANGGSGKGGKDGGYVIEDDDEDDGGKKKKKKKNKFLNNDDEDEEEPPNPDDYKDERNKIRYRMGWVRDKFGRKRQWIVASVLLFGAYELWTTFFAPWFQQIQQQSKSKRAKGFEDFTSEAIEGKQQEMIKKFDVNSLYRAAEEAHGSHKRPSSKAKKIVEDLHHRMPTQKKANKTGPFEQKPKIYVPLKAHRRKQRMKRTRKAFRSLSRYCIADQNTRRKKKKQRLNKLMNTANRCTFVDMLLRDHYWKNLRTDSCGVEVQFPTGTYKQNPSCDGQQKRIRTDNMNFVQKAWCDFKQAWYTLTCDLRVEAEKVRQHGFRNRVNMLWEEWNAKKDIREGTFRPDTEQSLMWKSRFPGIVDKSGNLPYLDMYKMEAPKADPREDVPSIWPLWKKDEIVNTPEWDVFISKLNRRVPHGARPPGSKPYLADEKKPIIDPQVY